MARAWTRDLLQRAVIMAAPQNMAGCLGLDGVGVDWRDHRVWAGTGDASVDALRRVDGGRWRLAPQQVQAEAAEAGIGARLEGDLYWGLAVLDQLRGPR